MFAPAVVASDDTAFYANMLRAVVSMAQTCQSPVPINEAMEIIRVLDAETALPLPATSTLEEPSHPFPGRSPTPAPSGGLRGDSSHPR